MTVLNRRRYDGYRTRKTKQKIHTHSYPDTLKKGSSFVNEANDFEYKKVNMKIRCRLVCRSNKSGKTK